MKIHVEIYLASRLLAREQSTLTPTEIISRVEAEFGDSRPGVRTQTHSHAVANAPKNAGVVYNYLWRVDTGNYRCYDPSKDVPHPSRLDASSRPSLNDVPPEYRYLLENLFTSSPSAAVPLPWNLLDQVFTVGAIMTPLEDLLTAETGTEPKPALVEAVRRHFDVILQVEAGRVVGVIWAESGKVEALTGHWLISRDTSIPVLLSVFVTSDLPALLVLYGQDVVGLVVPADLNKISARAYVYSLIGELEVALAAFVQRSYANDPEAMLALLSENRRSKIKRDMEDMVQGDSDVDPIHLFYFKDLVDCVAKNPACYKRLGYSSRSAVKKELGGLVCLRNQTMHMVSPLLTTALEDLCKLCDRVTRAQDWLAKLRSVEEQQSVHM